MEVAVIRKNWPEGSGLSSPAQPPPLGVRAWIVTIPDQTRHPHTPSHTHPTSPGEGQREKGAAERPTFPEEKLLSEKGYLNLQTQSGPDCPSPPRG